MMATKLLRDSRSPAACADDFGNVHGSSMWVIPALPVKRTVGGTRTLSRGPSHTCGMAPKPRIQTTSRPRPPLAKRLVEMRLARNLTQADLSAATGLDRGYLGKLETGGDVPGRDALQALAAFYGVSMDYLQNGTTLPGDDVTLDPAQHEKETIFLRLLRRLTPDQQELVATVMHGLLKS